MARVDAATVPAAPAVVFDLGTRLLRAGRSVVVDRGRPTEGWAPCGGASPLACMHKCPPPRGSVLPPPHPTQAQAACAPCCITCETPCVWQCALASWCVWDVVSAKPFLPRFR
jgi:hypothetical protein